MSIDGRQVQLLLGNALRMDFRPRGAESASRWRRARPLVGVLLIYAFLGTSVGMMLVRTEVPLFYRTTLLYAMAAILVILNLMIEYQEILFSPLDSDVVGWRPIASGTLYVARVLHVLVYVALVTTAQLAVPGVLVGAMEGWVVAAAFAVGALVNALFATGVILLLYGAMLRRLSPDRFQDVLAWVQLGFMVSLLLAYQLLTPAAVDTAFGTGSPLGAWFRFVPAGWYAALPALAAGPFRWELGGLLVVGAGLVVLVWARALGRLSPGYALEVESVRVAAGSSPGRPVGPSLGAQLLGRWLGRQPLRQLGFDFFLAQMRGDRRIRVALLPLVAVPVALGVAGLVLSRGADPYVIVEQLDPAGTDRGQDTNPASGPDLEDGGHVQAAQAERYRGIMVLFTGSYMMAALAASIGHAIGGSPDWRAAWVFHAAPLERYDQFYSGIMWGVVYKLVLPAVAFLAVLLLLVWRDPAHVVAHVTLPAGLALLAFPMGAALHLDPPFTREPIRHARGIRALVAFLVSMPMLVVALLHYQVRDRQGVLVAAGVLCAGIGGLAWSVTARRLRSAFQHTTFAG